jgi:1,4-alpha-glucan branching enzyme
MAIISSKLQSAEFKVNAPKAKKVSLVGSFNGWDINSIPAKKDLKGNWTVKINLKPGRYEYKFCVDGTWVMDANCTARVQNPFGTQNCVIELK